MPYKQLIILAALCSVMQKSAAQGRDTAFAIHKLFLQKRQHGENIATGGISMVTDASTLNSALCGLVIGAGPAVLGLRKATLYSAQHEQEILTAYANGTPLPAEVRRQLRRKHFHRTIKDIAGQVR